MDPLSRLVGLARPEGTVDVRCLLAGRFALDNPARRPGEVPFHLLLEGRCAVEFAGRTIALRAGDVLLFPRGAAHRLFADRDGEPVEIVEEPGAAFPVRRSRAARPEVDLFCGCYHVAPGAGDLLFRTLPEVLHVSFGADGHEPVRMLSALLRREADAGGPGGAAIVSSLCNALLAMVLRVSPERRLPEDVPWTAATDEAVLCVIDAVLSEPGRAWNITSFAARAAMSRATFIRHFTRATGVTVGQFVTRLRMMIAADLLADGRRSVSAVADAVGYCSASAFGRAFRAATSTSPARFRAAAQDGR
ncbi:AraC family transcriptional regulator [Actinomadura sp. DC4]|uniref:cupin domain-containing protein n=1 Tax=Actinomadura sp. DC4 TaxID=3055069 RepID=UPI0025B1514E|nr:AraC family transcriptional regulator [Actinomadura sp. DC4]MDN3353759.1 AraC family transcriptional regulator [Actinomadura sp. DC4]